MKDKTGRIIYVGKAKALKNRVTTYFHALESHNAKTRKLVENIYDFDFIVTPSELDALVLECSLIKQYNPKYNILLKDDKGYNYIKITKEQYDFLEKVISNNTSLPLPQAIANDIQGLLNALSKDAGINTVLFYGASGTGKTEATKQIARLLGYQLYAVDFNQIIDRSGETKDGSGTEKLEEPVESSFSAQYIK